jgi:hypothetical protein
MKHQSKLPIQSTSCAELVETATIAQSLERLRRHSPQMATRVLVHAVQMSPPWNDCEKMNRVKDAIEA